MSGLIHIDTRVGLPSLVPGRKYLMTWVWSPAGTVKQDEAIVEAYDDTVNHKICIDYTYNNYQRVRVYQEYETKKYDVFYSDVKPFYNHGELAYEHGSVYTVPKVEPKQWRTITTVGTTTTYGDWKLLSQETPAGTEGTNYEYMKESYIVRDVKVIKDNKTYFDMWDAYVPATGSSIRVVEVAEVTDEIHGDVVSKFRTPNILDNIDSYTHTANETNGGVLKTRRIKGVGAVTVPLIARVANGADGTIKVIKGATGSVPAIEGKVGESVVLRFAPPTGKTIVPQYGTGGEKCRIYNNATGTWTYAALNTLTAISPADAQGCTYKWTVSAGALTGELQAYFNIT